MKKDILKVTLSLLFGLSITSCSGVFDDLAKDPNHQDVNGFYTTSENINKGVLGIYSYVTTPRCMGASGCRLMANRGDEGSDRSDYGSPGQYTAALTSSYYTIVQPYSLFYTAASQACQMIDEIPNVDIQNKELKDAYLGESYFLRAFSHWFLFLHWRNIPLMKELPKSSMDYKPQAAPEETWDFIISDLIKAKELLPKKGFWGKEYPGRVTKAAATALLGKAYLYRSGIEKFYGQNAKSYYNEAVKCFDEIIKGEDGVYKLAPDYNNNFTVAGENNDESVFELQFLGDAVNTGFNPGLPNSGAWRDPRGFYPPNTKNSAHNVMHDWIYDTFIASKDVNGYTDHRMFSTLIFDDSKSDVHARPGDKVTCFDGKTFSEYYGSKGFGSVSEGASKYKCAGKKGIDWTLPTNNPGNNMHMWNQRANGLNYTYIRYADILLMYAESIVMGGTQGSLSAVDAVNLVRKRVNLPALSSVDMNAIETERVLELTEEGHRFFDLLRWGKLHSRFKELEASDPNFKQYGQSVYLGFHANKDEWLPIPIDEVEGNPYIKSNNPGWN